MVNTSQEIFAIVRDVYTNGYGYPYDNNYFCFVPYKNYVVFVMKTKETKTNEDRLSNTSFYNKCYGKFRADVFQVVYIFEKGDLHRANFDETLQNRMDTLLSLEKKFIDGTKFMVGNIIVVEEYNLDIRNISGAGIEFYKSFEAAFYKNPEENTDKNGLFCTYDYNGDKTISRNYVDNKLNGEYKEYSLVSKQRVTKSCSYINDDLHGKYFEYKLSHYDEPKIECEYVDGKLHGDYILKHDTKNILHRKGQYKNGMKHGTFYEWNRDGCMISKETYEDNLKHGECKKWNESGLLTSEQTYKLDLLDGTQYIWERGCGFGQTYDYITKTKIEWKNGMKHGEYKKWNAYKMKRLGTSDENLVLSCFYSNDVLHGNYETFSSSDYILKNYINGINHGVDKIITTVKSTEIFVNRGETTKAIDFYMESQSTCTMLFKNGKKHGKYVRMIPKENIHMFPNLPTPGTYFDGTRVREEGNYLYVEKEYYNDYQVSLPGKLINYVYSFFLLKN